MKARVPKGNSMGGAGNLQQLATQAQKLQKKMDEINAEMDEKEYTSSAGGQAVKVTIKGDLEIQNIEIQKDIIDPEETDMLTELLIAAVNSAIKEATKDRNEELEKASGSMNMGIPGLF